MQINVAVSKTRGLVATFQAQKVQRLVLIGGETHSHVGHKLNATAQQLTDVSVVVAAN